MTNADTDKQELIRLNAEYSRCVVQRAVEGLDRLLTDDEVIGPDGERVENKEDRLNYLKEPDNIAEYLELSDLVHEWPRTRGDRDESETFEVHSGQRSTKRGASGDG